MNCLNIKTINNPEQFAHISHYSMECYRTRQTKRQIKSTLTEKYETSYITGFSFSDVAKRLNDLSGIIAFAIPEA